MYLPQNVLLATYESIPILLGGIFFLLNSVARAGLSAFR